MQTDLVVQRLRHAAQALAHAVTLDQVKLVLDAVFAEPLTPSEARAIRSLALARVRELPVDDPVTVELRVLADQFRTLAERDRP